MMEHPSWEQLIEYAEGMLPGEEQQVATHLETCYRCAKEVEWLDLTLPLLSGEPFQAPPPVARDAALAAFDQRVSAIQRSREVRRFKSPWYRSLPGLTMLAAVAAVLLFALLLWRDEPVAFVAAVQESNGEVMVSAASGSNQMVSAGYQLVAGDEVATGVESEALLDFGGGAVTVQLLPESQLRVEQIMLEDGTFQQLIVRCQRGTMITTVRDTDVTMHAYENLLTTTDGTFRVEYLPDHATAVEVREGQLQIENQAGAAQFEAGESALLWFETVPGQPLDYPLVPDTEEENRSPVDQPVPNVAGEDDFFGLITETAVPGTNEWIIGGRVVPLTAETRLEEKKGAFTVGACVEVRLAEGGIAERIRTVDQEKCEGDQSYQLRPDSEPTVAGTGADGY